MSFCIFCGAKLQIDEKYIWLNIADLVGRFCSPLCLQQGVEDFNVKYEFYIWLKANREWFWNKGELTDEVSLQIYTLIKEIKQQSWKFNTNIFVRLPPDPSFL